MTFYIIILVLFRYLSDAILAATKVLSEAMAEFKKITEKNDITFQNLEDIMIETKETFKTVRVSWFCLKISLAQFLKETNFKNEHKSFE